MSPTHAARRKCTLTRVLVEQVRAAVRGWEHRARALGATSGEIAVMQGVIDPER